MNKSLLFLPDISGFTEFVQNTEVNHSQHVISELLEVLIAANSQDLLLAEIEGDALFFYKEEEIPSMEKLLAQIETMFTAFFSHLQMLEKNRVCPCNACATAPNLQLKIIAHCGELQFISVQNNRKPFGSQVIEAHRLMKNSVQSDNYVLLSKELSEEIMLSESYQSKLFKFKEGSNEYDGKELKYLFSIVDNNLLKLNSFSQSRKVSFDYDPVLTIEREFPISANQLLEYITNYTYRHLWVEGVDKFEYNENEVTRIGTEHVCVINGKYLNFVAVTKEGEQGEIIYGEMTTSVPIADEAYQFYIIRPLTDHSCQLKVEGFWHSKSWIHKLIQSTVGKRQFSKNTTKIIDQLLQFTKNQTDSI